MEDINKTIEEAKTAIEFIEDAQAAELLKKIEGFVASENLKENNPGLYKKFEDLIIKLKIVGFPNMNDRVGEEVLRHHYLKSFDIDVPIGNRLTAKLFLIPFAERNELRERFKKALVENDERLGNLTIGQWIQKFEKAYENKRRNKSSPVQFTINDSEAAALNEADKRKLKEILNNYDYYLVATIPTTGEDLEKMLADMPEPEPVKVSRPIVASPYKQRKETYTPAGEVARKRSYFVTSTPSSGGNIVNMSIEEAMKKFNNLGEQVISSNPIKLKIFPNPVRPSIKNWITDYHQVMGQGQHGVMERGNYMYHSENARRLMQGERQRLATILKSLEEKIPLAINTGKQVVIFTGRETPPTNKEETTRKENIQAKINDAVKNLGPQGSISQVKYTPPPTPKSESSISFSSPQKFTSGPRPMTSASLRRPVAEEKRKPLNPFKIEPVGYPTNQTRNDVRRAPEEDNEKPEPKVEGNVVDLRGDK